MSQVLATLASRKSFIAAALLGVAASAHAQTYPTRPVTVVFPYPAPSDLVVRAIAGVVSKSFGQSVVVENRTGGNEVPMMLAGLNAPADGYTIVGPSQNLSLNPLVQKLPYTPQDFTGITRVAILNGSILMVRPEFPAKTAREFVDYAKANPGKVSLAYIGNHQNLSWVIFQERAGVKLTLVPYKGTPDVITGITSGSVDAMTVNLTAASGLIKDGRARAIAAMGSERIPDLNVPLIGETVPGHTLISWQGLAAKTGTPQPILERWAAAVKEAVKAPEVIKVYQATGFTPIAETPGEMAEYLRRETDTYSKAAKSAGFTPQ